jgi:hypothetical protein
MGGALGRSMTESHEKMTFFNFASWKVYFSPKVGVLIALNSKPLRFSKLVVRVLSYVPGKCTTVIVVNWAKIGRSMKDRKFRVQSSLFRSLWPNLCKKYEFTILPRHYHNTQVFTEMPRHLRKCQNYDITANMYNVVRPTRLHYFADYMSLADFSSSLHYTGNSVFLAFLASLVAVAGF